MLQTWNGTAYEDTTTELVPGALFTALKANAKITDQEGNVVAPSDVVETGHYNYTIQLKAVYKDKEVETPTHIDWYSNYGSENDGKGTLYHSNTGIKINEAVEILGAQTRKGYTFKGWTKTKGGTTADFLVWTGSGYTTSSGTAATHVAADEKQPYEDLFAVWEEADVTINYAVASDSTDFEGVSVAPTSETIKAASGTAAGSTASSTTAKYIIDYWTCDDGTEHVGDAAKFTPSKNADGIYEAHTYYAHFKLNEAEVTVHHYLKGTTTKVADDVTTQQTIGSEYTAQPVTTYQEKNLTVDSYNPSQPVTVSVDGNEITIYYTLPLTITAKTDSKEYDGTPLTGGYTARADDALAGDLAAIQAMIPAASSITEVSSVTYPDASLKQTIEAQYPYYVVTVTQGTLTVTKSTKELKVESLDGEWTYDGTAHTKVQYKVTYGTEVINGTEGQTEFTLSTGDKLTITPAETATITHVAESDVDNAFTWTVANEAFYTKGEDTVGKLTVTPATLTITAASDKKVYDGDPLTNDGYELTDGKLATGDKIDSVTVTGSQTLVGSSDNVASAAVVKNGETDVTANYEITYVKGTLTVTDGTNPPDDPVDPKLVVTKTAEEKEYKLGDTVTFTITATNIYAEAQTITLSEIEGVTLTKSTFENVAGGETVTTTATYTITEADVLKGSFKNTVTAKLGNITMTADATVNTEAKNGHLTINKETTSTAAAEDGKYALGETISYKITVLNDGNLTITDITVEDELTEETWTIASLAPNASEEFETSYTVTEADILAGKVVNEATGEGTSPDPDKPDVPVTPGTTKDDPEDPKGHITITKETTSEPANGEKYALDEEITYKITVKNDGNLTITDIKVTDELTGDEWTLESLAPGKTQEYEAKHKVTEDDILAGEVVNEATAEGTSPDPDKPDVPVTPGTTKDDPEDPKGHITITKETTSEPANGEKYALGEEITYKITVKNDGNLTITDITVEDELTGDKWNLDSLAPGATKEYEAKYTVTEADILEGEVVNVATGTGKSPDPDKPDVPVTPGTTTDDPEDPKPAIVFTKTANKASYQPGETVTYTFTVKNTGNLTINDLSLVDNLAGIKLGTLNKTSIAPGETATATATYDVTVADVDADRIVNTATVNGKDSRGESISGTDTVTVAATASYTINYVFTWPGGQVPGGAPAVPAAVTVNRHGRFNVSTATYADIPYGIAPNGNVITVLRFQGWDTGNIADVTSNRTVRGAWTIQMVWYTVTYTDGVPGQVIFPDQVTTTLRIGANTPAFAGTPTREGFNFTGWAPAVSPTVTGNNVYTAQWAPIEEEQIVEPTPEPTPVVEEEIVDEEVPQAAPGAAWALINLLAALGTVATAVGMIITFFKKKDDDDDGTKANPDEESDENKGKKSKFLGLIPAVASVIIFILTENMHNPMTLVDKWTIPMVLILAANGIVAYLTRNKKPEDEDTEKAAG